jgi:hypothetical protein
LARYLPSDKIWLREIKTCSEDIEDGNAPYWRRLAIDAQVSVYVLSEWQQGVKVDGTMYDVIRKPSIRPKEISKAMRQQILVVGEYCATKVSMETRQLFVCGAERENEELFEARLAADCLERPQWYFQRRSIPRMDCDVHEFACELWDVADEIRLARQRERHTRNSGACMTYKRPCEFLGLCSGHDSLDSDKFVKRSCVHAELSLDGDGRDLLSHSRMQTFKTCRRKHYLRYELGIERADEEEADALHFGKLMHRAIEAWWSYFSVETHTETDTMRAGQIV